MENGKKKGQKQTDLSDPPPIKWNHGPPPDKQPLTYATWTNKGGVGKTTLTFQLSSRFAERAKAQGWNVLVVDLCPQANVSMTLLQSEGTPGSGVVEHYMNKVLATTRPAGPVGWVSSAAQQQKSQSSKGIDIYKTVAGWLLAQRDKGDSEIMKLKAQDFLVRASEHNENIPDNLYLVCGDMDLEIVSSAIVDYRDHMRDKWLDITYWIGHLVQTLCKETEDHRWAVFIDTNPSMNFYTQLALGAAQYLIMPVNADDYSEQAVKALFRHVYDVDVDRENGRQRFPKDMDKGSFAKKAAEKSLPLPKVQVMINNRAVLGHSKPVRDETSQQAPTPARASRSMGERICAQLLQAFEAKEQKGWSYFVRGARVKEQLDKMKKRLERDKDPPKTQENAIKEAFNQHYLITFQDFMSTAILSGASGTPLSRLKPTVRISDTAIQTRQPTAKSALRTIDELIDDFLVRFHHEEQAGEDEGGTAQDPFEELGASSSCEQDHQDESNQQPSSTGLGSSSQSVSRGNRHSSSAEKTLGRRVPATVKRGSDSSRSGRAAKRQQRSYDHEEHGGEDEGGTSQAGNPSEGLSEEPDAFSFPEQDDQDQSNKRPCSKGRGSSRRGGVKSVGRSSSAKQKSYQRTPAKAKRTSNKSSSGPPAKRQQRLSPSSPIPQLEVHGSDSDSVSENVQGGSDKHRDDGSSSDEDLSQPVFN